MTSSTLRTAAIGRDSVKTPATVFCLSISATQMRFQANHQFQFACQRSYAAALAACDRDGRGGCKVDLELKCGSLRSYPVLRYAHLDQAEASAHRLNDFFSDPSRTSIALEHDLRPTLLLFGCGPLVIAGLILALR
jgi:hypothetical protein